VLDSLKLHPLVFVLSRSAVDPLSHQLELLASLTFREPVRALIADEVGLGKTLEASLMVKYYEASRDRKPLVLVVVPRILLEQWREELQEKLKVNVEELKRSNIKELVSLGLRDRWYIISLDLMKRREYLKELRKARWNFVIVDEAHKLGNPRGREPTQRYKAVEELTKHDDVNLLLLSATPHRGDPADYLSRLKLLDPYLTSSELDNEEFYSLTRNSIVFRRTKLDINRIYEKREVFKNASYRAYIVKSTPKEKEFYEKSLNLVKQLYKKRGKRGLGIVLTVLAKRLASSPYAAKQTLLKIVAKESSEDEKLAKLLEELKESLVDFYSYDEDLEPDEVLKRVLEESGLSLSAAEREALQHLADLAAEISEGGDSKAKAVVALVKRHLQEGDDVVIFSEYKDTATYLFKQLRGELGDVVALITSEGAVLPGGRKRRKEEGMKIIKRDLGKRIKVLVATDVASEGLNLQSANVLINYELVWSPVKLEQRLGRVWRYGQKRDVISYVIVTDSKIDKDVLETIYAKLLAMKESIEYDKPLIGNEIVLVENVMDREVSITTPILQKGKEFSEYEAIVEYLEGGREALESYINAVMRKIIELRKQIERLSPSMEEKKERFEHMMEGVLGSLYGDKGIAVFWKLSKKAMDLANIEVEFLGTKMIKVKGQKKYYSNPLEALEDALKGVKEVLEGPISFLTVSEKAAELSEVALYKVSVMVGNSRAFETLAGYSVDLEGKWRYLDTLQSLELLAEVLDRSVPALVAGSEEAKREIRLKNKIRNVILHSKSNPQKYLQYLTKTEKKGFAEPRPYLPKARDDIKIEVRKLAHFYLVKSAGSEGDALPRDVEEVEKKAMEIVIDYEKSRGRIPKDVSSTAHYDVHSIDPKTGEERLIEVKGRANNVAEVVLTSKEVEFAKKNRDKYWLYMVLNVFNNPKIIMVKDPIPLLEEFCEVRYKARPDVE